LSTKKVIFFYIFSITQNLTAKCYKTRFLEAGIVNYPEQNQMVYISPENLPTIAEKFKGCKIVIEHKEVSEQEAQQEIVGYVNNIYMEDGWAWANFTIHSQEAIEAIDNKGYSTSCAYQAVMKKQGGVKNAVEYEDEVIDIVKDDTITHIALVENPRYNDAIILENSINNKIKNKIMNIFKFKSEKEGSKELTLENSLFEIDGEEMPVSEMVSYYKNAMAEKKANKCKYANGDDKIDVDGEEMTISELANFYKKNKKKNEEMKEEDKKENEEKEEDKKENEDKEEDKKENEDMKEEDKKENEDKEEDKKENEKEEEEEKKGNTMKNSIGVEKGDDLNANGIKYENGISNPCKPKVASIAAMLERGQNMFSK
jgi:hypothetical protein